MKNIIKKMKSRGDPHDGRTRALVAKLAIPSLRDPVAYAAALKILG